MQHQGTQNVAVTRGKGFGMILDGSERGGDFQAHVPFSLDKAMVHGFITKVTYKQLSY